MARPEDKIKGKGQEMEEILIYVILSMSRITFGITLIRHLWWVNMTYCTWSITEGEYAKNLDCMNQTFLNKNEHETVF